MKTKTTYGVLTFLLFINIWQITRNRQMNSDTQIIQNEIISYKKAQLQNDKKQLEFDASFNDITFPSDSIGSLSCPTLIYVYTDTQCGKCITEDISIIRNNIDSARCRIFPILEDTRSNRAVINSDLYGLNYHRLDKKAVAFPMVGDKAVRFMAVINEKGELLSPFYLSIATGQQKLDYLRFVKERYDIN